MKKLAMLALLCSSCFVATGTARRPHLSHQGRAVRVYRNLPPQCRAYGGVTGWARASSRRAAWVYAVNDLRNKVGRRGANAVLFVNRREQRSLTDHAIFISGRLIRCATGRAPIRGAHRAPVRRHYRTTTPARNVYRTRRVPVYRRPAPVYRRPVRVYRRRTPIRRPVTSNRGASRCYSDRECGGGVCRSGKCTTAGGRCYSDRECPGGVCRSGKCTTAGGRCYSDRECGGGVCRSGKCTTAGGRCYSDRECGGGVCRSGKCTTAGGRCYSDRECGGGVCRSGKCTTAGGRCYSDRECPGGSCRSGRCTR